MNVLVSIATKKTLHAELVKWLLSIKEGEAGIDIVNSPYPLEHARNLQVKRFMESPYDCLFIVDSDCVPPRQSIDLIRHIDLPILSIPHPSVIFNPATNEQETGLMVMWSDGKGGYDQRGRLPFDKLQECDAVGCSGLAIKREVFEKVKDPYFRFVYSKDGFVTCGEDFDFCARAKATGYKIYAYTEEAQRHYVEVQL